MIFNTNVLLWYVTGTDAKSTVRPTPMRAPYNIIFLIVISIKYKERVLPN